MQTGFFGTLLVPHMKNMSWELYACTSIWFPSVAKKLSPALDRQFSPAYHWLWMAEKAHAPISRHAAFPPILLVLYWLAQEMDTTFTYFSYVLFE